MGSALSWTVGMQDRVSGVAKSIGNQLGNLSAQFDKLNASSKLTPKVPGMVLKTPPHVVEDQARIDASARALGRYKSAVDKVVEASGKLASRSAFGKTASNSGGSFGRTAGAQSLVGRMAQSAGAAFGDRGANAVLRSASALNALHGALTKTRFGVTSLASAGKAAVSTLGSIAIGAAAATAAVAAMGLGVGVAGARYIAGLQSFKSSMMFSLAANLGGAKAAEGVWAKIAALAVSTGSDLQQTAVAFNGLLAGGFKLGEAEELMKLLADMKTLDPTANLDGMALAIKQIKMTGKLQGDELNQLGNVINQDAVFEELAKKLGKSKAEVLKMKEAGKITADDAIAAIKSATLKKTGMAAGGLAEEAAGKTLVGNLMRAKAVLDVFLSKLNIDFSPVARFLEKVQKVLTGDAGTRFGKSIEGASGKILGILDSITEKDVAKGFDTASTMITGAGKAAEDFSGAIKTIDGWIGKVSEKTSGWGLLMNVAMMGINGAVLGVKLLLAPFFGIKALVEAIGQKIGEWAGKIQKAGEAAGKLLKGDGAAKGAQTSQGPGEAQRGFVEDIMARFGGDEAKGGAAGAAGGGAAAAKTVTNTITVSANGLTFAEFEQRVAEVVRRELASGADAPN